MRILAIETATLPGSMSLLHLNSAYSEAGEWRTSLDASTRTTETFSISIAALLRQADCCPDEVTLVAATTGPGSFTGLRIGVTAAKVFAYAVNAHVLGVNTLEVIARQSQWHCLSEAGTLTVVMDAQRNQLFSATFEFSEGKLRMVAPTRIYDVDFWLRTVDIASRISGPGLERIRDRLPSDIRIEDESRWKPQARTVANVGAMRLAAGEVNSYWALTPEYFRRSAAEENAVDAGIIVP